MFCRAKYSRFFRVTISVMMVFMVSVSSIVASQGAAIHEAAAHERSVLAMTESGECPHGETSCAVPSDAHPSADSFDGTSATGLEHTDHGSGIWCSEFCISAVIVDAPDLRPTERLRDIVARQSAPLLDGEQVNPYRPPTTT